jgi:hypothetical protein
MWNTIKLAFLLNFWYTLLCNIHVYAIYLISCSTLSKLVRPLMVLSFNSPKPTRGLDALLACSSAQPWRHRWALAPGHGGWGHVLAPIHGGWAPRGPGGAPPLKKRGCGGVGRGVVVLCSTQWKGPLLEEEERVWVADNVGSMMTAGPHGDEQLTVLKRPSIQTYSIPCTKQEIGTNSIPWAKHKMGPAQL